MPYMKKQTQVNKVLRWLKNSPNSILVDIEDSDGEEQWHRRGHEHPEQDHGEGGDDQEVAAHQDIREAHLGELSHIGAYLIIDLQSWANQCQILEKASLCSII